MRILAVICGIILLLPGLCAIGFIVLALPSSGNVGSDVAPLAVLWIICFAISGGGIFLIIAGLRPRRPPPSDQ